MNYCTNCGQKINESSRFCTKCGSREAKENNLSPTPKTRMEKKKSRSKTRLMAGVGSIMALLLVSGVTYSMVKGSQRPKPKPTANVAATKMIDSSKDKNIDESNHKQQSKEEKSKKSSTLSSTDTILPASDKRVMQEEDLATLTKGQLRLARNEIYARHGYIFKSEDLQKYFANKSWYHPNPSFDGSLNEVEKQNVAIIKAREDRL